MMPAADTRSKFARLAEGCGKSSCEDEFARGRIHRLRFGLVCRQFSIAAWVTFNNAEIGHPQSAALDLQWGGDALRRDAAATDA